MLLDRSETVVLVRKFTAVTLFLTLLSGCRDSPVSVPRASSPNTPNLSVNMADSAEWNHFAADVSITLFGGPGDAMIGTGRTLETKLHLERDKQPDGGWASTVTLPGRKSPIPSSVDPSIQGDPTLNDIRRMDIDAYGRTRRSYTGAGNRVDRDPAELIQKHLKGGWKLSNGRTVEKTDLLSYKPVANPNNHRRGTFNSSWLKSMIVQEKAKDEVIKQVELAYGKPSETAGGRSKFVRIKGDTVSELFLDSNSGGVVEAIHSVRGKPSIHVKHTYSPLGNGVYIRSSSRTERSGPGNKMMMIEVRYTNISLGKKEIN